ncbi:PLDc_N domain-containing protein [Actinotalea sp. BY-33]|uniref:PLDc_N domain-containing protein n=2 Tax=Actinotalea TaxID=458839 RepID=A0A939LPR5_9CELL|nr:PLD nuclease N-terminal domain-containing protein [Actinotalea soli]MBO1752442.1 PLDc_N domain-containing protein [Actinotalea soli]
MLRAMVYVIPIALAIYALIDLSRSQVVERNGLPVPAWVAVIVLLPVIGPVVWILLSRQRRREQGAARPPAPGRPPGPGRPRPRRSGPVAPDDDPDFLWRLEQERRRQRARDRDSSGEAGTEEGTTTEDDGDTTER